jgi:Sulfotransferase family
MIRNFRYSSVLKTKLLDNEIHGFAQQNALRLYRSDAIYTFIPKNACSTMRLSLAFYNGCVDNISDFDWIHLNNSTFQADLASLACASYTFVILRCPYSRLASVYLDKIVDSLPDDRHLYSQLRGENPYKKSKILNKISVKKRNKFIDSLSFYDFVMSLRQNCIRKGNTHWRPQVDFLVYEDYDDWFCVEEFSKAVAILKNKINLNVVDARQLTLHGTGHLKKIQDDKFSNVSSSAIREIKKNGECPSQFSLYNDELIEMVNAIYSEDIDIYKTVFGAKNLMFS